MNEATQIEMPPIPMPDWWQIDPREPSTIGIVDSLNHLSPRLAALADLLTFAKANALNPETMNYVGCVLNDYAVQIRGLSDFIHAQEIARGRQV